MREDARPEKPKIEAETRESSFLYEKKLYFSYFGVQ